MTWQTQRMCRDQGEYELIVEKEKNHWECEQKRESWKWSVVYHGTIVSSGSVNKMEEAQAKAMASVPGKSAE